MTALHFSAAPRWVPCPASASREAGRPRGEETAAQREGIACHWLLESVLRAWIRIDDTDAALALREDHRGTPITDDMRHAVRRVADIIMSRCGYVSDALQVEKQAAIQTPNGPVSGRIDALAHTAHGGVLTVFEAKFGRRHVPAYRNWQLACAAIASMTDKTHTIRCVVVAPNRVDGGDLVAEWETTRAEMDVVRETLLAAAASARSDNPPASAGYQCRGCGAAAICEELRLGAAAAAKTAGEPIEVDQTDEALGTELDALALGAELIRARRDALEGEAVARIMRGGVIPGYTYGPGRANRAWTVPPEQVAAIGSLLGVELTETKTVSPAKAERSGVPVEVVARFTERVGTSPKLRKVKRDERRR